jgi:transposase
LGRPQEIADEEHEQMIARVCAIDVGKQAGTVCTRVPHGQRPERRVCTVWDVAATFNAVSRLAEQLVAVGIGKVTVESTSDYVRHEGA